MPRSEGKRFRRKSPSHIKVNFLETIPFDCVTQKIVIETKEFSAVCPFSGLPDIAKVVIVYYPVGKRIIELKSLKYYFMSFRDVGVYQEQATAIIFEDLSRVLGISEEGLQVITTYNTRGGMDVVCQMGCNIL